MGRLVAGQARALGHEIAVVLSSEDAARGVEEQAAMLRGLDAVIDFSTATAVPSNIAAAARAGVPLVEGTTGWQAVEEEALRAMRENNGAMVWGANFSIGVQVFYRIAAHAASMFRALDSYEPFIEEAHHARKKDAPSGTALQLQAIVESALGDRRAPVVWTRAGYIPGTHRLGFDSQADQLRLTHEARNREGFAAGALLAARWIAGRRGIYRFSDVFDEILREGGETRHDDEG